MVKRRWYEPKALLDMSSRGAYWYRGGVEWRAVGAWAAAIVVGYSLLAAGQNGIGWLVTFAVAAAIYGLLGGAKGRLTAPAELADDAAPDAGILESEPSRG
jgi:cytosine/uracil/thiamine/allantoin permease